MVKSKKVYIISIILVFVVIIFMLYSILSRNNNSVNDKNILKEKTEEKLVNELTILFNSVNSLNQSNINNKYKYLCFTYLSNNCSDSIFQKQKIDGNILSLKFMIYNTLNYLNEYKRDELLYGNVVYEQNEEYKDKYYYIKLNDFIKYLNKIYNVNYEEKDLTQFSFVNSFNNIDSQGIFLGKVNNDYVYFINGVDNKLPKDFSDDYYNLKLEIEDNIINMYVDYIFNKEYAVYETDGGVVDYLSSISKFDDSDKIYFNVNDNPDLKNVQYKEYYTKYKISFKENDDSTYTFLSSEPIINKD